MLNNDVYGLTSDWRRLNFEEIHNLNSSTNSVHVIKSKGMRWPGYVTYEERTGSYKFWLGNLRPRKQLERPRHRWEDTVAVD